MSAEAAQRDPRRRRLTRGVRGRYALTGLFIGTLIAVRGYVPLWEEAARLLALTFLVIPTVHAVRVLRQRGRGPEPGPRISLARLVAAKLTIDGVALLADALLTGHIAGAHYLVGAGVALLVAGAGPLIHPKLQIPSPAAHPSTPD